VEADRGFTHVALPVSDVVASVTFYERFAVMRVVHRRVDPETQRSVVWLSDLTRPFVLVLIEVPTVSGGLGGSAHLGVGCESRAAVDHMCALARDEGHHLLGPTDSAPPVGYWAIITDPDGHNLELSYGQEVALTVGDAAGDGRSAGPPASGA
jgi:catechol 2,3-dioxygenase-like lactoylglutathione lyase family enzyme